MPLVSLIGVVDTGGKLPLVANLPAVSTTLRKLVAKFAVGVVDTSGKLLRVLLTPVANCRRCR